MLHLFNQTYIAPIDFAEAPVVKGVFVSSPQGTNYFESFDKYLHQNGIVSSEILSKLYEANREEVIYLEIEDFYQLSREWFSCVFHSQDEEAYQQFMELFQIDTRLKANRFDYTEKAFYAMRSFNFFEGNWISSQNRDLKIDPQTLSFELLLYNALTSSQETVWKALLSKIRELSWKKLIYDWLILRNQIINAFSNDLSLLLPWKIDFPEDPRERLTFLQQHEYFKWMFDKDFRPENWDYIQKTYNPKIYADLYNSWIRYRKSQPLDSTNEKYIRLLKLIEMMTNNEWKELLMKDLKENWVSVYIESEDYKKHNLAMIGKIYDDFATNQLQELSFLKISERIS